MSVGETADPEGRTGETFRMTFRLGEYGWASMVLEAGTQAVEIGDFGYLTDALGDLVRSALQMAAGGWTTESTFNGEPELWGILIDDGHNSECTPPDYRLRVMNEDDWRIDGKPMWQWERTLLDTRVTADVFAAGILTGAQAVLDEFGEQGYVERWLHAPFPTRGLAALRAALSLPLPPDPRD